MTLCTPVFSLKRFQIFDFRGNIYPLPLTRGHISPVSAFFSKLKPSLLACSAATLAGDPPSRCSASLIQAGNFYLLSIRWFSLEEERVMQ